MSRAKKKTITLLVVWFFTISIIFLTASLTLSTLVQEFKNLDVRLTVANHLGFNTDTDKLYLGTVPRGNTASRSVIIENNEYKKSIVRLKVFGELKNWITVSENNFVLKKGESKIVKVEANVPEDAELKNYESRLVIFFTRI